jgi:hypothetical protein
LPSITKTGPGLYEAICVGDPAVNQDWVAKRIDPIVDVVPIPNGPTYACPTQTITLTASGAPDPTWTYKWYVLKDAAAAEFYAQNAASANLFVTAPQLFNNPTGSSIPVTGPGSYFVQLVSPNSWTSQVRELKVENALPTNLQAINTSPAPLGGSVNLSIGQLPTATTYTWAGPAAYTATGRQQTLAALTEAQVGTYTVSIALAGGCTFTATTEVLAAGCDFYVEARNAAGTETYELSRIGAGVVGAAFEPLTLKVLPFTGTIPYEKYSINWYKNGTKINGAEGPTYTANTPGKYTVQLKVILSISTVCEASTNLNAKPCKTYVDVACGGPVVVDLPNTLAAGVELVAGDKFTAGDFTIVVSSITSGSPAGYTGEGYLEMRLVAGIVAKRIGVTFTNAVINDCYELAGGKVETMYDPDWKGVLDVDEALGLPLLLDKFIEIEKELIEFIDLFNGTPEHVSKLDNLIRDLQAINTSIQSNPDYDQLTKSSVQEETDGIVNKTYCLTGRTNPNGRVSSTLSACTWTPWTALAQCLGGAAIDVFMQYTVKWLELIADGNSKNFVNDFTYIKSRMPWQDVVISAGTSCVFSALPIPLNKASYAIIATGALVGAAEGLSRNIIIQYNTLKDQHSFSDIPKNINWQSAFQEAAIQGISQAVVIAITRNLSQSQKLSRFAANLANKVKASPAAMRQLFRNAGLTDEVIEAIYKKLGVKFGQELPTTLRSMTSAGGLSKSFFEAAEAAFDLDPAFVRKLAASSVADLAAIAEKAFADKFIKDGYQLIASKIGSNNGIDILLVDSRSIGKIKKMIIIEVKSFSNKEVPQGVSLGEGYGTYQMTDEWINALKTKYLSNANIEIKDSGKLLQKMIDDIPQGIEKYVGQVDFKGASRLIKLN